jgi:hypothetical protein
MKAIRSLNRQGMVWMGVVIGTIIVAGTIAASAPSRPIEPAWEEAEVDELTTDVTTLPVVNGQAKDLVVHEWGTFLGMNASDGTVLDGMYHEEHALPSFVHGRSRDQLLLPMMSIKGETPVIYFYAQEPVGVHVVVDFRRGIWTQWYPQATMVRPSLLDQAESPDRLTNGRICWYADVIPAALVPTEVGKVLGPKPHPPAPLVPETRGDSLWNFARDVDAAFVRTIDRTGKTDRSEYERFLFYRGLGQSRMPMRLDARSGGSLALENEPSLGEGVRHIFVLKVENGRGAFQYRPALRPGEQATGVIPAMADAKPLAEFAGAVADALVAKLTESGLYPKEARAMVNTWKSSYFQNDGIRVLFVLPQSWTNAFIPMTITPKPRETVRVMVGRLELLSPEREQLAEAAVHDLAGPDPARRLEAYGYLRDQGRYVEPIVRRIAKTTQDEGIRTACRQLLLTEMVTDLRSAVHNAANGEPIKHNLMVVPPDPLLIRAQLSRLLREIGRPDEARAEAGAVWRVLRDRPEDPNTLEILAAVHEAQGDDRRAGESYARRLEMHVKSFTPNVHPDLFPWLREWWIGRAYARCLVRTGQAESAIASLQERLERTSAEAVNDPANRLDRVRLGLLLDARGELDRAEVQWSSLMGRTGLKAAAVPAAILPKL